MLNLEVIFAPTIHNSLYLSHMLITQFKKQKQRIEMPQKRKQVRGYGWLTDTSKA